MFLFQKKDGSFNFDEELKHTETGAKVKFSVPNFHLGSRQVPVVHYCILYLHLCNSIHRSAAGMNTTKHGIVNSAQLALRMKNAGLNASEFICAFLQIL